MKRERQENVKVRKEGEWKGEGRKGEEAVWLE